MTDYFAMFLRQPIIANDYLTIIIIIGPTINRCDASLKSRMAVSNVHMYIYIKNRGCSFRWSGSYFYLLSPVNCSFLHMNNCDMIVNIPSSMQDPRAVQVWRIEVAASDDERFYLLSLVCPRQPSALARPQPTKLLPPDNHGLICQLVIGQLGPEIC